MKIGSIRKKESLRVPLTKEHISSSGLFNLSFTIQDKIYDLIVDEIVSFKKDYSDWSDADMSIHLEQCSFWRTTFASAIAELMSTISQKTLDFQEWYAHITNESRDALLEWRKQKKESGIIGSWLGSITKQEIEDWILLNPKHNKVYKEYKLEIEDLKIKRDRLIDMKDTIVQRASDLKKLIDDRLEIRRAGSYTK